MKRCNRGLVRVFRNARGSAWLGKAIVARTRMPAVLNPGDVLIRNAKRVTFGVGPNGAGDLLGFRQVTITTEMVGRTVAVFLSAEAKSDTGRGRVGDDQARWRDFINRMGGIAVVFESAEELDRALAEQFDGVLTSATDSDHD